MDFILLSGFQAQDICHTDLFDWWESIYLEGLSAVSKFILPQVPSSISAYSEAGSRLSATTIISYLTLDAAKPLPSFVNVHLFLLVMDPKFDLWIGFLFIFFILFCRYKIINDSNGENMSVWSCQKPQAYTVQVPSLNK